MNIKQWCIILLCFVTFRVNLEAAPGEYKELKLHWSELSRTIDRHRISVGLNTGSNLEGNVVSVGADSIELDVRKTSSKANYPKGRHSITRAQIATLDLHSKGFKARGITLAAGAGILVATTAIGFSLQDYAGLGVFIFGAIAGLSVMIGGYFIANEHDRRLTRITLLTD